MQLARAAAARTLTDWATPEPAPRPNPAPTAGTTPYKPTDPAVLFTRLATVVRDCIALESRLAATATPGPDPRTRRADPRRAPLHEALRNATKNHPDRAALQRETTTRLDAALAADPAQTLDPGRLLFTIADDLGIEIDLAHVPDEFLTWPLDPPNPNEPVPRATSPP